MAHTDSDVCEMQLDGVSEVMDLLQIDLETDVVEGRPGGEDPTCSKNVLRKQRNWERQLAAKKSKRKEEKQRRRLNREKESGATGDAPQLSKRVLKAITKERLAEAQSTGLKLCVDLSMTDSMSDKEMDITEESCLDLFPPESVVYLTPDAEEALETVDADKVYVLGGLVDESIQKKLSYSRACELGIRTARLPIDEYMAKKHNPKNFHSKILAINQVFDILLTFCNSSSWREALQAWFPPGKGFVVAPDDSQRLPISPAQT
ncbi:tRNA methyltransferase 10 homolog B isoform 2-T3 [Acanthopagrus schlegelii]